MDPKIKTQHTCSCGLYCVPYPCHDLYPLDDLCLYAYHGLFYPYHGFYPYLCLFPCLYLCVSYLTKNVFLCPCRDFGPCLCLCRDVKTCGNCLHDHDWNYYCCYAYLCKYNQEINKKKTSF